MSPADLLRAAIELGLARLRLKSEYVRTLIAASAARDVDLDSGQAALVERVKFFIPRVAARLPWRADCLVQAMAAQRWLASHQIDATLTVGVLRDTPIDFEAHAWLTAGDQIVTGGDISGYVPLNHL